MRWKLASTSSNRSSRLLRRRRDAAGIGGAGGKLKGNRWIQFGTERDRSSERYEGRAHNELLVTLLNLFGIDEQKFGHPDFGDGPLTGIV